MVTTMMLLPLALTSPVPFRLGLLFTLKPPPWMKKKTGSLDRLVAFEGA